MALRAALLLLAVTGTLAAQGANPIRKVVTLMQNMQKEITAEGEKEKELFEKFMCFCNSNTAELTKAAADGKAKVAELTSKLEAETAEKSQTAQALIGHKSDKAAAEKDLAEATAIREKEAAEYAEIAADSAANIKAVGSAIGPIEQGMGGAALMQLPSSDRLGKLFDEFPFQDENDQKNLLAFFQGGGDYAPASGQIVGILKTMLEEMETNAKEAKGNEEAAAASFASLKASKESEIETAAKAIEDKGKRAGELGVSIVETQDDLEDTETANVDTEKFISNLDEQCATKDKEWAERQKVRAEEITAISEAIGILNDDDALDVFKKTMPSPSLAQEGTAFLQRSAAQASPLRRATTALMDFTHKPNMHSARLGLMLFSLKSRLHRAEKSGTTSMGGFEGVTKMIDDMVRLEDHEQADDDKAKPWCNGEFNTADREETAEKNTVEAEKADIDEIKDRMEDAQENIATASEEIKDLDKAVSDATEQRKDDHIEYVDSIRMSQVAVELVDKAANRMKKFYNPTLYRAPPKKERTMTEKIIDGGFLAQIRRTTQPAAPDTFGPEYEKSDKGTGVVMLMDSIIRELNQDIQDAERDEKSAQKGYQDLMANSQQKRMELTKSIEDRMAAKAALGIKKEELQEKEMGDEKDVLIIQKHVLDLHGTCDFILQNYDERKEARAAELGQLKSAKAALAGAN